MDAVALAPSCWIDQLSDYNILPDQLSGLFSLAPILHLGASILQQAALVLGCWAPCTGWNQLASRAVEADLEQRQLLCLLGWGRVWVWGTTSLSGAKKLREPLPQHLVAIHLAPQTLIDLVLALLQKQEPLPAQAKSLIYVNLHT